MLGFIITLIAGAVHIPWIVGAGRKGSWWKLALALAIVIDIVLVSAIASSGVWVAAMWFTELGQASVFWTTFWTKVRLFAIGSLSFFLFLWANALFIRWKLRKEGLGTEKRGAVAFVVPSYFLTVFIGALVSIGMGVSMTASWSTYLQFGAAAQFNKVDPVFARDIGFYIYTIPWYNVILQYLSVLIFATAVLVFISYLSRVDWNYTNSGTRDQNRRVMYLLLSHGSFVLACALALLAWKARLDMWELVYSTDGVVVGAGYTDLNARLPVFQIAQWLFGIFAIVALVGALHKSLKFTIWSCLGGFGGALVLWLVGMQAYPALVQHFNVSPNEFTKEQPYIKRNIVATREAYNLTSIHDFEFPIRDSVTESSLRLSPGTLASIRLWDWRVLMANNHNRQALRTYYGFPDVDVDRYTVQGKPVQLMVAPRELYTEHITEQAQTWQNLRLVYTHGMGVCMNPSNVVLGRGEPDYWVKDIPAQAKYLELGIKQPRIYYGEETNSYVFVQTSHKEFDYPSDSGTNVLYTYEGSGGVPLGSGLRKLALAWHYDGLRMLMAQELNAGSRILFKRNVMTRVKSLAPFLRYDQDPYCVVVDSSLFYMVDAYTVSSRYPYSEKHQGDMNYIRNSVKVVVDAFNGKVTYYVSDATDPMIQTWGRIFPNLFTSMAQMPASMRKHIRYPEDMLNIQADMLCRYHMNEPGLFYNQEDAWDVAKENDNGSVERMPAFYTLLQLPGNTSDEYVGLMPFTPHTMDVSKPKNNMVAWIAARCDGDKYGELDVYRFPKDRLVYGPLQVNANINQDDKISKDFTLWNQKGSRVIQRDVLVIPLSNFELLYVAPIYLQADNANMPQLQRVVVASQTALGYGETFADALQDLLSRQGGYIETPTSGTNKGTGSKANNLSAEGLRLFKEYKQLVSEGKFSEAGRRLEELGQILERMESK
jgi:uncharacterized protein